MYPENYIQKRFLTPINIIKGSIRFVDIKDISEDVFSELILLYMSIYNSDNVQLIKEFKFDGTTEKNGIWDEDPWDIRDAKKLLDGFIEDADVISVVVIGKDTLGSSQVIGAGACRKQDKKDFIERKYVNPFPNVNLDKIPLYYTMEVFKRKINDENGKPIRHFSEQITKELRNRICKKVDRALIYSSTNNKYMLNIFKREGRKTRVNDSDIGNKYQSYFLLECQS